MEFYASCPEGFESALADELKRLGLSHVRRLKGRATFEGELEEGYRACLWSRLASRVFVVLGRFEAQDADELYDSVYDIAWETIIRPGATIAITARGVTEQLRNTRFSALRAKDALCDRLAETTGRRADVDAADPDVHLLLSLRQRRASISLDLSGDPLFKRLPPAATRAGEGAHVLRPDYAALVLAQVGWTALCERELTADDYENEALPTLIDASCAGGGLLLGQLLPLVQIFPVELAARLQQVGAPLGIRLSQASELVFRLLCQADGSYIIPFFHQSCGLGHQPQRLQVHVRWILLCPGGGGHGAGHIRPLGQKGHGAAGQGQSKGNAKGERSHHGEKLCLHTAHRPESQE